MDSKPELTTDLTTNEEHDKALAKQILQNERRQEQPTASSLTGDMPPANDLFFIF